MLRKWRHLVATFPGSQLGNSVVITNFTLPTKWTFMIISIHLRSNDYNRTHKHTPTHISPNTHTQTLFFTVCYSSRAACCFLTRGRADMGADRRTDREEGDSKCLVCVRWRFWVNMLVRPATKHTPDSTCSRATERAGGNSTPPFTEFQNHFNLNF